MLRKIKKLFSFLSLVLLGLLFPNLSSASVLADLGTFIVTRPFFGIAWVLTQIAIKLVGLSGSLLNWVLSRNFISLSYTNPANNPIIETGLGVTRGFVNMLLVLVLVYIAIATILRLAGYETKKLLVTFVVVALLVNFAPVICGLIVDASNIIMNFFVQDLKADAFGTAMGTKVTQISSGFEWLNIQAKEDWGRMFQLLIMAGFLFYLCLILGIFTLIFILRYLVIWLLVILSPLAFVCYILPATRKYFEQWWQQFLAWSFIGVTCGFFLYLGLLMVSLVPTAITAPTTDQGGAFDPILPYFVSVVFLGLGIVFGLQTSAMGAKTAVNIASTKGRTVGGWTGRKTLRAAGWTLEKAREKLSTKQMRDWGVRQAARGKWGESETGVGGYLKRAASTINPLRYALRGAGKVVGGGIVETQQKRIKQTEDSVKDTDKLSTLSKRYHNAVTDTERIGIMNKIIERGEIGDAMNEKKLGKSAITSDQVNRIMGKAKKWDSDKTLKKAFPHIAGKYITTQELAEAKTKDPMIGSEEELIISKLKPADYKNISEEALKNVKVVDNILKRAMGGHISQLIEQHGAIAAKALEDRIDAGSYINPRLDKYLTSAPGRALISPNRMPRNWNRTPPPSTPPQAEPVSTPPPPPSGRRTGGGMAPSGRRPGWKKIG